MRQLVEIWLYFITNIRNTLKNRGENTLPTKQKNTRTWS